MPVNPDSVIPTWVNDYHPDFYVSITDKENYAYTNVPADKGYWMTLFTNLSTAMTSWKNIGRESSVGDLISAIYNYVSLYLNFAQNPSILPGLDAYVIFDMNSFITSTLARGTDYYDDLNVGTHQSPKMTADITTVGTNSIETGNINIAISSSQSVVRPFLNKAMFEDIPPVGPLLVLKITNGGSGYTDGIYNDVELTTLTGTGSGAFIDKVQVSKGSVIMCLIDTTKGLGYKPGDTTTFILTPGSGFIGTVANVLGSGKHDLGEFIFNTLNYKKVYQILNVGDLTLPPYIT